VTTTRWDPTQYLRYADERSRPFFDLVSRIATTSPREVVDLGCGPGTLTATLRRRWPDSRVTGIDSSPEMVERASLLADPPSLEFVLGDLRDWRPSSRVDVVVSNAALQWVPGHLELLTRWLGFLDEEGTFAFQVPGNLTQPSHALLYDLAHSPRWAPRLAGILSAEPVHEPAAYVTALSALGAKVDAWETTYLHVLSGPDAVLEWVRGTTLLPLLATLDAADGAEFIESYAAALREAYPANADGRTIYPFRRIFVVAQRGGR
jgi:trans-aconitate 2-methyltransferase